LGEIKGERRRWKNVSSLAIEASPKQNQSTRARVVHATLRDQGIPQTESIDARARGARNTTHEFSYRAYVVLYGPSSGGAAATNDANAIALALSNRRIM
jgi:hypothetical protein